MVALTPERENEAVGGRGAGACRLLFVLGKQKVSSEGKSVGEALLVTESASKYCSASMYTIKRRSF